MKEGWEVQKILSGRRLSLPKWFMEMNNLKEGDYVLLQEVGKHLRIAPAKIVEITQPNTPTVIE